MKGTVYCLEVPTLGAGAVRGATYGCSQRIEDAIAALDRGRKRGVSWGEIKVRKSAPRGMRMNEWLPPFDARKAGFR
jgi:hypothetical protein